jgi:hypothetical protein
MTNTSESQALSLVLIALMRGLLHAEKDPQNWQSLLRLQGPVRDYVSQLGLDLMVNEEEGFAWLRNRIDAENDLPSLVARRPLSYPVSLLLALLRRKLAEHDSQSGESRLILSREQIAEMLRMFHPSGANEAKLIDQIDTHINKAIELGFVRKLRGDDSQVEVLRVLKAFVDAQWLTDFDAKLVAYQNTQEATE